MDAPADQPLVSLAGVSAGQPVQWLLQTTSTYEVLANAADAVLKATGIGGVIADSLHDAGLPVIFAAYVISCGLRIAQGSATAAIAASAAIIGPTIKDVGYSQPQLALIAAAICAGSIIASHVNDGGFWIVSRYFGISVKDTLKTWTVLETILSVVGFAVAAILMAVI